MEFSLHGVESETHAQVKPAKKSINRQQGRGIFPPNFKNPDRLLEPRFASFFFAAGFFFAAAFCLAASLLGLSLQRQAFAVCTVSTSQMVMPVLAAIAFHASVDDLTLDLRRISDIGEISDRFILAMSEAPNSEKGESASG